MDLVDRTRLDSFLRDYPSLQPEDARWNSPHVEEEAIAVLRVPRAEQGALLERLRADRRVESAEPNWIYRLPPKLHLEGGAVASAAQLIPDDDTLTPRASFPNDPLYDKQWNMELVHARDAWRYATGRGVIVAIIDTGVAYEDASGKGVWAPDLKGTRFVPGYDFVNKDRIAADDHGHGTHCAGTVAQSTNNGRGVIGLAHEARIMPLKVLTKDGWGTAADIADAIRFAADNGAHVISMSLGGGPYSQVMKSAIDHARAKGCVVVCAAGNGGRAKVEYPAAYPGALAISSVGPDGSLAFYSSYGKETFLAAPGGDMQKGVEGGVLQNTLDPRDKKKGTVYAYYQGTSMATPHAAAAAALLFEVGVTRADAVGRILATTARGDGWNQKYGHGVLDAGAAVRHAVFVPSTVALILAAVLLLVTVRRTDPRELSRGLLVVGALAGACGLFFLRPLGLGEVPLAGPLLARGIPDWDLVLLGPSWHWSPLFASALIPAFLGLIATPTRFTRSLGVGLALGWSARLMTGVVLPYTDVRWIPGQGALDAIWLGGNALVLLVAAGLFVRLGRSKDPRVVL